MFGLDARIALSIFAGLSVITGVSMVQVMKDNRTEEFLLFHQQVSSGFAALQEDIPVFLRNMASDVTFSGQFATLLEESAVRPAYRSQWNGPYIQEVPSIFRTQYGNAIGINSHNSSAGLLSCSLADRASQNCSQFLHIGNLSYPVDMKIINKLNDRIDGAGEATPKTSGKLRWNQGNVIMEIGTSYR